LSAVQALQPLLERLPHRAPFRFLSRLSFLQPEVRAEGVWSLSGQEDFFAGHFPGDPIVPGVLLGEALAQLAGLLLPATGGGPTGVRLARVDLKFPAAIRPPADVALTADLRNCRDRLALFEVAARVHGDVAASGHLVLAMTESGAS
jgi:3-hydroxyacyl-[acyl-carrier-protein] dehydratase